MACCPKCGKQLGMTESFNHVARPNSHSQSDSWFLTDKLTKDPAFPYQRFLSTDVSGYKVSYIYSADGCIITQR